MTRRAPEVKLFSTSFLDLLFCALSGVLVLWVLTGRSEPPFPETAYGFFRLSQGVVNHISFCEVRLLETNELVAGWRHPTKTNAVCSESIVQVGDFEVWAQHLDVMTALDRIGLMLTTEGAIAGTDIQGRMTVAFSEATSDCIIDIFLDQCRRQAHVVSIFLQTNRGVTQDAFVWQTLPLIWAQPGEPPWEAQMFPRTSDINCECSKEGYWSCTRVRLIIVGGTARLELPPPMGPSPSTP